MAFAASKVIAVQCWTMEWPSKIAGPQPHASMSSQQILARFGEWLIIAKSAWARPGRKGGEIVHQFPIKPRPPEATCDCHQSCCTVYEDLHGIRHLGRRPEDKTGIRNFVSLPPWVRLRNHLPSPKGSRYRFEVGWEMVKFYTRLDTLSSSHFCTINSSNGFQTCWSWFR